MIMCVMCRLEQGQKTLFGTIVRLSVPNLMMRVANTPEYHFEVMRAVQTYQLTSRQSLLIPSKGACTVVVRALRVPDRCLKVGANINATDWHTKMLVQTASAAAKALPKSLAADTHCLGRVCAMIIVAQGSTHMHPNWHGFPVFDNQACAWCEFVDGHLQRHLE